MIILRPYQRAALDSIYAYWDTEGGSPLIELATGTGKSIVLATLIRELLQSYPSMRVLCLVHVRELVQQNFAELLRVWPGAPAGVNSAGLGRRDYAHPILFASIQSVHRHAAKLGRRDLILIDEAHLLPAHGEGMYHELLKEMTFTTSPDLRLFGCTATPYRLDSGRLDRGDGRLFDRICYTYGIGDGIRDGFLSPLIAKSPGTEIDVSKVGQKGGEFLPAALGAVAECEDVTRAAVAEIVTHGVERRSWLIFASSVRHAHQIAAEINTYGISCAVVTGETPAAERASTLAAFKAGHLRALANMSVLTTGFDAPGVDLIAMLRPTLSVGLFVQMIGRGTRLAPGKTNTLVLDFSGNVRRHGPVDEIEVREKQSSFAAQPSEPEIRTRLCSHCLSHNSLKAVTCVSCSMQLRELIPQHASVADTAPVLSGIQPNDWRQVDDIQFKRHEKFGGGTASMQVAYVCGRKTYTEYLCFDHELGSYPRRKAERWWKDRGGDSPAPASVDEALAQVDELAPIGAIRVVKDGEYWRVISYRDQTRAAA